MHSDTYRGLGPVYGEFPPPDPVFPLNRKRALHAWRDDGPRPVAVALDPRTGLPPAWPFATELDPDDPLLWADDDDEDPRGLPQRSGRSVAVRVVGSVALIAALFGCGAVLSSPDAKREAIDWVTLGHPDVVLGVAHRAASALRALSPEG
jgi:hypothetical protein